MKTKQWTNEELDYVRSIFEVDVETGSVKRIYKKGGKRTENKLPNDNGYILFNFNYNQRIYKIYAHHIVWLFAYGEVPNIIDHKNGDKLNNAISNLRLATPSQNQANTNKQNNNTSGHKGVHWNKRNKKWVAKIGINGKGIYLGCFTNIDDAASAYDNAAQNYFGEFARLD